MSFVRVAVVAGSMGVSSNHAVDGNPLTTSINDHNGTVATTVNLLGDVVAYTDVHGTRTETVYDQTGRPVSELVNPPGASADRLKEFTYDDAGRVLTAKLNGTVLAAAAYDSAGELATVNYGNGSALSATGEDQAGRPTSLTWQTTAGAVTAQVTRTITGTIVDESLGGTDARPGGPNYQYDALGRLTEAWVPGHHYTYDFTSSSSAGCPAGSRSNARLNTNRVRMTDQTATATTETGYCYDSADRILASTGPMAITGFTYGVRGNTTGFTNNGATTQLGWDAADRQLTARTTGADPAGVAYLRDATDRIVTRNTTQGDTATHLRYSYTGSGDTADLTFQPDGALLSHTISLPGGVLYTERTSAGISSTSWDHPNIDGDVVLTTNATGAQVGPLRSYSPYGEPLNAAGDVDPDHVPDNQPEQWTTVGSDSINARTSTLARWRSSRWVAAPYLPVLGRFLSVDPEEGGSSNDYEYVNADPVSNMDLDGELAWFIPVAVVLVRVAAPVVVRAVSRTASRYGQPHVAVPRTAPTEGRATSSEGTTGTRSPTAKTKYTNTASLHRRTNIHDLKASSRRVRRRWGRGANTNSADRGVVGIRPCRGSVHASTRTRTSTAGARQASRKAVGENVISDRVLFQWSDFTDKTANLWPWWVGCQTVNRGPRTVYWRPVEEAVAERLNRDSAIEEWLTAAGLDYVLIELGRPGLQLFRPGRVTKFDDGGCCFELGITDEIANSTNLDEVQGFLTANAIDGLAKIASKLRVSPPSAQALGNPAPAAPRGRVADIAMKEGSDLPVLLISPRHSQRPSFRPLKDALAGSEREVGNGWAAYALRPDASTEGADFEPVYDFTGIERPFDPDVLLRDSRNIVMLIAPTERPLPAQRAQLAASLALVNDHIAIRATVSGNDSGVLWTAGGVDSFRSRT